MSEEFKAELIEFLKENLTLDQNTTSDYTGSCDGGPMYTDSHTIRLVLAGETIGFVYL